MGKKGNKKRKPTIAQTSSAPSSVNSSVAEDAIDGIVETKETAVNEEKQTTPIDSEVDSQKVAVGSPETETQASESQVDLHESLASMIPPAIIKSSLESCDESVTNMVAGIAKLHDELSLLRDKLFETEQSKESSDSAVLAANRELEALRSKVEMLSNMMITSEETINIRENELRESKLLIDQQKKAFEKILLERDELLETVALLHEKAEVSVQEKERVASQGMERGENQRLKESKLQKQAEYWESECATYKSKYEMLQSMYDSLKKTQPNQTSMADQEGSSAEKNHHQTLNPEQLSQYELESAFADIERQKEEIARVRMALEEERAIFEAMKGPFKQEASGDTEETIMLEREIDHTELDQLQESIRKEQAILDEKRTQIYDMEMRVQANLQKESEQIQERWKRLEDSEKALLDRDLALQANELNLSKLRDEASAMERQAAQESENAIQIQATLQNMHLELKARSSALDEERAVLLQECDQLRTQNLLLLDQQKAINQDNSDLKIRIQQIESQEDITRRSLGEQQELLKQLEQDLQATKTLLSEKEELLESIIAQSTRKSNVHPESTNVGGVKDIDSPCIEPNINPGQEANDTLELKEPANHAEERDIAAGVSSATEHQETQPKSLSETPVIAECETIRASSTEASSEEYLRDWQLRLEALAEELEKRNFDLEQRQSEIGIREQQILQMHMQAEANRSIMEEFENELKEKEDGLVNAKKEAEDAMDRMAAEISNLQRERAEAEATMQKLAEIEYQLAQSEEALALSIQSHKAEVNDHVKWVDEQRLEITRAQSEIFAAKQKLNQDQEGISLEYEKLNALRLDLDQQASLIRVQKEENEAEQLRIRELIEQINFYESTRKESEASERTRLSEERRHIEEQRNLLLDERKKIDEQKNYLVESERRAFEARVSERKWIEAEKAKLELSKQQALQVEKKALELESLETQLEAQKQSLEEAKKLVEEELVKVQAIRSDLCMQMASPEKGPSSARKHASYSRHLNFDDQQALYFNATNLSVGGLQPQVYPMLLCKMISLQKLDLHGNQLSSLPEDFSKLTNLTFLWISENKFNQLPEPISFLKQLKMVYLYDNPITELPPWLGNLERLCRLNIHGVDQSISNTITRAPRSITTLPCWTSTNQFNSMEALHALQLYDTVHKDETMP